MNPPAPPAPLTPTALLDDAAFAQRVRRAVALPDAPAAWQQAARAAWQQGPAHLAAPARAAVPAPGIAAQAAQALQALRELVATLSFDSWAASPLATGLRGLRSDTRQCLYSTEGRDIDLRIHASGSVFALSGQILGPDEAGTVSLSALPPDPAAERSTALDAMGEFHLDGVGAGRYLLTLRLGNDHITLPPVELGAPGGA